MRVRHGPCGNGVYFAVDGTQRVLGRALVQYLDVRHLNGRIQCGFPRKHGGVDDVYFIIEVATTGHERERVLASHQSYLDVDAIEQVTIL